MWKFLSISISVLFPPLLIIGGVYFHLPPRLLSVLLVVIAITHFLSLNKKKDSSFHFRNILFFIALGLILSGVWFSGEFFALKLYPVAVSLAIGFSFAYTLWFPPSMVFRLASLSQKNIKFIPSYPIVERYCYKVSLVWVFFCFTNAFVALATSFASDFIWSIYNGFISYMLMGTIFIGEFMIRKIIQRNQSKFVPFSALQRNSRSPSTIISFNGNSFFTDTNTWNDYTKDVDVLREFIQTKPYSKWILHSENSYYFAVSLLALLQLDKEVLVTANIQPAFISEIKNDETGFLSGESLEGAFSIQELLQEIKETSNEPWPKIDPSKALITLYTSGSTGRPKRVPKLLLQFENELNELITLWKKEYEDRFFISTVNHHHIYGLLLSIFVPLSLGLPFRRYRIDIPEELNEFSDKRCAIISSPAFLKRLESRNLPSSIFSEIPFIHSSGGVLPVEASREAFRVTSFWPQEIYGSTETGGIAHRQSKDGLEWTPFAGCKITLTENQCLNVKSSLILDEDGFTTGDLAEFTTDGKFILKGRADSIVKIEEKRISLTEVEMRLKESGLVKESCAVALTHYRQFLAVALVLNEIGQEKFKNSSKLEMNQYFHHYLSNFIEATVLPKKWRFIEELPVNSEGKLKREDVEKLFAKPISNFELSAIEKENDQKIVFHILFPENSDYFDGHFESFKLIPAVVQIDLVMHLSSQHLLSSMNLNRIPRIKFCKPIRPNQKIRLEIEYKNDSSKINFLYSNEEKNITYSSGYIFLESH
jgi:acyl-coenzyme A synthetase/AMP-(fatty) acid ligase/uncharacterized membrane protein